MQDMCATVERNESCGVAGSALMAAVNRANKSERLGTQHKSGAGTPLALTAEKIPIAGGLPPFDNATRFFIHPKHQSPPFVRIECEDQDLSFLLIDPFLLDVGYKPEFFDADFGDMGLQPGATPLILAIVNLNRGIELASCNLVGPILLDPVSGKGKQVVLKNATNYSSRQAIFKQ